MERKIKQAIITAGGFGTRLRPLTLTVPKVMIPINGKPLLEHHVNQFKKHGVTEFFFTLHYLPDVITSYFGDGSEFGVKIHYFTEDKPLGTAGALRSFKDLLDDKFFYIYGDIFSLVNYSKMAEEFYEKRGAIGMQRVGRLGYRPDVDLADIDDSGRIVKIYPKPHVNGRPENPYSMRGVFLLKKEVLGFVPENTEYDMGKQLLPDIVSKNLDFYGYECDDYSQGIDNMEKYQTVEEYLKNKDDAGEQS